MKRIILFLLLLSGIGVGANAFGMENRFAAMDAALKDLEFKSSQSFDFKIVNASGTPQQIIVLSRKDPTYKIPKEVPSGLTILTLDPAKEIEVSNNGKFFRVYFFDSWTISAGDKLKAQLIEVERHYDLNGDSWDALVGPHVGRYVPVESAVLLIKPNGPEIKDTK